MHFAAYAYVDESVENPSKYHRLRLGHYGKTIEN